MSSVPSNIVGFPLRLLFVPLFLRTNIFKGNPVCRKAHRIVKYLKIKMDESEYRTQGTNVSLSKFRNVALLREHV